MAPQSHDAQSTRRPNWIPFGLSAAFVVLMAVSSVLNIRAASEGGVSSWTITLALFLALGAVLAVLFAAIALTQVRITARTQALRRDYPTAYVAQYANDAYLANELARLVRGLQGQRVKFPVRGTQTLVIDSLSLLLVGGGTAYRVRAELPVSQIESVESAQSAAGRYGFRDASALRVTCRTEMRASTLDFHLLRFTGWWPKFLTSSQTRLECEKVQAHIKPSATNP